MAPHLLHGTIHATIFEVDRLHSGWDFNACFKVRLFVENIIKTDKLTENIDF
ncbi:putative phospholipase D [Helianthus anomalus]